jgi:hypothetical protein
MAISDSLIHRKLYHTFLNSFFSTLLCFIKFQFQFQSTIATKNIHSSSSSNFTLSSCINLLNILQKSGRLFSYKLCILLKSLHNSPRNENLNYLVRIKFFNLFLYSFFFFFKLKKLLVRIKFYWSCAVDRCSS